MLRTRPTPTQTNNSQIVSQFNVTFRAGADPLRWITA
jgi:hypothetical protein